MGTSLSLSPLPITFIKPKFGVEGGYAKIHELGYPQTATVQGFQYGPVSFAFRFTQVNRLNDPVDFRYAQKIRQGPA